MPEAEVTYADVKFIRTKRGGVPSSDNITYSDVRISKRELPADSHQHERSCRSKVTWERVALLVFSGFLVAAVIALGFSTQNANNLDQSVQILKEENEALRKNISGLKCGADWEEHGGKCYYFSSDELSWQDSRQFCRDAGGDLVKIDSREEQEFLVKRLRCKMNYSECVFWIGLTNSGTEGRWVWADGSPLNESLSFWTDVEFNKPDCVTMRKRKKTDYLKNWLNKTCYKSYKSICEK